MMEQKLLNWVKNQQNVLDQIIYEAGNSYHLAHKQSDNFAFDLSECQSESYNLISHLDLCYDRPNTAFVYSLWYHGRRVNTFISFFVSAILKSNKESIEIFDLGAGTGAVQFAVGLVCLGMKELGLKVPRIKLINIDSSPIMLYYNRDFLWKTFLNHYPTLNNEAFKVEYSINSWNVNTGAPLKNPWIVASYLFDMSDQHAAVSQDFLELVNVYRPSTFLLLTSKQPEKVTLFNSVIASINKSGYSLENVNNSNLLFNGPLLKVNKFRNDLSQLYPAKGLGSMCQWRDESFIGAILKLQSQTFEFPAKEVAKIDLYNSRIKVRKDVRLSKQQEEASNFLGGRPSIIVGPAGSGKSIVISEKIKNICLNAKFNPSLKILVTTFNRGLIKRLGDWIENLLGPANFTRKFITDIYGHADEACEFIFSGSTEANITLLNFDLLPTKIGNLTAGILRPDKQHIFNIKDCITKLKKEKNLGDKYDNVLNAEFILEEYHRIFYGLNVKNREDYIRIKRSGRWQALNQDRRELVYKCVEMYRAHNDRNNIDSTTTRRQALHRKLVNGEINKKYDYIFVDEFQDCTRSDYEIFYNLIKDVNNLTLAGDLAQAIHVGKSAGIPRDDRMRRREYFLLEGSYRLPQRISESIKKLSAVIVSRWGNDETTREISPVKKSPPGARPIVVYAAKMDDMVKKLGAIFKTYSIYDVKNVTVLEKDEMLKSALGNMNIPCESDTILRLKGLEKECVLWSTRMEIDDKNEIYEYIYTILTRTSSILIIALSDSTVSYYKKVINLLDRQKIILWDKETKNIYNSFCEEVEIEMLKEADS